MPPKRRASSRNKKEKEEVEEQVEEQGQEEQQDEGEEAPPPKRSRTSRSSKAEKEEEDESGGGSLVWKQVDSLWYLDDPSLPGSSKIVGFDMDATLIVPSSGAAFPKNRKDWRWWHDSVPAKLAELNKAGYKVVIFSNQAGVEKGKQNVNDLKGKILDISKQLGFPLQAFLACATDHYRKPNTTMWDFFEAKCNGGVKLDLSLSKYVGDAAGRPKGWKEGMKKDIHAGDRAFAFNCRVAFETPEEFFLGEKPYANFDWGTIDPATILQKFDPKTALFQDKASSDQIHSDSQEMVVMVGCPASGKSTFSKKYLVPHGYVHVNQDTLKTKDKCLKAAREAVAAKKSVVVDNTNGDPATRAQFIAIAKGAGIPVRCFIMTTDVELAHHLNFVREKLTEGEVRRIPDVAYNMFKSKFKEPSKSEGFTEIRKINFLLTFDTEDHKKYFLQRTSDS